ncbi:hypothetical protein BMS3Abin03_02430 [bacterium BMS3Abin03]|nr:hypothetical protein BMS3Abin03_02430 [bacterium BMS3Abin03]
MKYRNFITIILMVIFVVFIGYSHGDEDKKIQKVTSSTINSENADSLAEDHNGENEEHAEAQTEEDFNTIRKDVEDSATFVVLKAVSLAVAIIGLAIVYLPRRKKEDENNA